MALTLGPRLRAFLDEVFPAVVGTARRDGTVAMTPVWFELADRLIWLNGGPNRAWYRHMERTGAASLLLLEPKNMFRFAQVEGRLAGADVAHRGPEAGAEAAGAVQQPLGPPQRVGTQRRPGVHELGVPRVAHEGVPGAQLQWRRRRSVAGAARDLAAAALEEPAPRAPGRRLR